MWIPNTMAYGLGAKVMGDRLLDLVGLVGWAVSPGLKQMGGRKGVELSDGDEEDRGYCYWVMGAEFHLLVAGIERFYFLVGDEDGFYFLVSRHDEVLLLAGRGDRFYVLAGALDGALIG